MHICRNLQVYRCQIGKKYYDLIPDTSGPNKTAQIRMLIHKLTATIANYIFTFLNKEIEGKFKNVVFTTPRIFLKNCYWEVFRAQKIC